jgi:hypothetical protein
MTITVRPSTGLLRYLSALMIFNGVWGLTIGLANLRETIAYVVMFVSVASISAGVLLLVRSKRVAILMDTDRIGVWSLVGGESWIPIAEIVLVTTARTRALIPDEMLVLWRADRTMAVQEAGSYVVPPGTYWRAGSKRKRRGAFAVAGIDQRDTARLAEAQSKLGTLSPFIISISGVDPAGRQQLLDALGTLS